MEMNVTATTAGSVRGEVIPEGVVFRGVPYAAAPVGARRYLAPSPATPWPGVRDCVTFGPIAPQQQIGEHGGVLTALGSMEPTSEDCLFLNVWTPAVDDGRRPTMVWIHGGAFISGSGSSSLYDGSAFARDGVVVVSINYRLNALGFLYLDELFDSAEGTGNLGILDQIAALEWVRDNIAAFGGDPDNVTIFGESAGGMSVATLLGTNAAAGLFRRAIAQSGAGHANVASTDADRMARRVLELLDVRAGDWESLRAAPVDRIVEVATMVVQLEAANRAGFQPVIDGFARDRLPVDAVRAGSAADVDLLVGSNTEEWRLFIWGVPDDVREWLTDPDITPYFEDAGRSPEDVLKIYAANRPGQSTRDLLAAVETDHLFTVPAIRLAEAQLAHRSKVWMYRFAWTTPVLGGALGACHALEVPFVFDGLEGSAELVGENPPRHLADAMHSAWVRFATTGDPSGGELGAWPAYTEDHRPTLVFDVERVVVDDPASDERRLWDGVI